MSKTNFLNISIEEAKRLAPYAVKSLDSRGRRYPEAEHPFRTVFQRDRDRIIHCNAFRRLEYKTQVFVYPEGDHYRTRLTHTTQSARGRGTRKKVPAFPGLESYVGSPRRHNKAQFGARQAGFRGRVRKRHGKFARGADSGYSGRDS